MWNIFLTFIAFMRDPENFSKGGGVRVRRIIVSARGGGSEANICDNFFNFYLYFSKFRNTIFFNIMWTFNISNHFLFIPLSFTHSFKNKSKRTWGCIFKIDRKKEKKSKKKKYAVIVLILNSTSVWFSYTIKHKKNLPNVTSIFQTF